MDAGEILEFVVGLVGTALYLLGAVVLAFLLIVLFVEVTYVPEDPPTKDEWRHM